MAMNGMGGGLGAEFARPEPDCEAVAQWRAATDARLAAKAAEEESAVAAKKAQAQKDLEQFYAERDVKVKARVAVNREEEKQYVAERDATVQEDSWSGRENGQPRGGGRRGHDADAQRPHRPQAQVTRVCCALVVVGTVCRLTCERTGVTRGRDAEGGDEARRAERRRRREHGEGLIVEERAGRASSARFAVAAAACTFVLTSAGSWSWPPPKAAAKAVSSHASASAVACFR